MFINVLITGVTANRCSQREEQTFRVGRNRTHAATGWRGRIHRVNTPTLPRSIPVISTKRVGCGNLSASIFMLCLCCRAHAMQLALKSCFSKQAPLSLFSTFCFSHDARAQSGRYRESDQGFCPHPPPGIAIRNIRSVAAGHLCADPGGTLRRRPDAARRPAR